MKHTFEGPERRTGAAAATAAAVVLTAWFLTTAVSQHPQRCFDRLRRFDPLGLLIPNWRFFAPEPAQHDYHVLHRVLTNAGSSSWEETLTIAPRRLTHMVWFPGRRREKALFDVVSHLLPTIANPRLDVTTSPPYRLLRDVVDREVTRRFAGHELPLGFQFTLVRYTGHDESQTVEVVFASPFEPLDSNVVAFSTTGPAV